MLGADIFEDFFDIKLSKSMFRLPASFAQVEPILICFLGNSTWALLLTALWDVLDGRRISLAERNN